MPDKSSRRYREDQEDELASCDLKTKRDKHFLLQVDWTFLGGCREKSNASQLNSKENLEMGDGSRQGASIDRQLDIVLTFQRIPGLPTTRKVDSVDKVEDDAIRICHFGSNSREIVCGGQCCLDPNYIARDGFTAWDDKFTAWDDKIRS